MATLQIAWKHHVGVLGEHLAGVHVSESPVVVSPGGQVAHGTGCVGSVPRAAVESRVQQAHVEQIATRFGVGLHQVVRHVAPGVALPMNCHAQRVEHDRVGASGGKLGHVIRGSQVLGNAVGSVVVAAEPDHLGPGLAESGHLFDEAERRRVVAEVAVVEVPGDQQQGRGLFDAEV